MSRPPSNEGLRSEPLRAALTAALAGKPAALEDLLRRRLEKTGYFAAHFRENAARALLLPRSTVRSRICPSASSRS